MAGTDRPPLPEVHSIVAETAEGVGGLLQQVTRRSNVKLRFGSEECDSLKD